MLLPSAFQCEGGPTQTRPQRPKLISLGQYQPVQNAQTIAQPKPSKQAQLLYSCRALQTILGNAIPSSRLSKTPKKESRNPFEAEFTRMNYRVTKPIAPPPRGKNKRRRDEYELAEDDDKENHPQLHPLDNDADRSEEALGPSTPKRRRRVPMEMPLGLTAEDFKSLSPPKSKSNVGEMEGEVVVTIPPPTRSAFDLGSRRCSYRSDVDSGYGPSPRESKEEEEEQQQRRQKDEVEGKVENASGQQWSVDEDRVLVETVLAKLQLSKRAWNDCARRLGKDKDSLGRRWRMLLGEGNVGLKRGGRLRRTDLEMQSW